MAIGGTGSAVAGWGRPLFLTTADMPYTVAAWVKIPSASTTSSGLFGLVGSNAVSYAIYFGTDLGGNDSWYIDQYDDTAAATTGGHGPPQSAPFTPDGAWHHLAYQVICPNANPTGGQFCHVWLDGQIVSYDTTGLTLGLGTQTFTSLRLGVSQTDASDPAFQANTSVAELCVFTPNTGGYDLSNTIQALAQGCNPIRTPGRAHLRAYHPLRHDFHDEVSQRYGLQQIGAPGAPVWIAHPPLVDPVPTYRRILLGHASAALVSAPSSADSGSASLTTAIPLAGTSASSDSATAALLASSLEGSPPLSANHGIGTLTAATHLIATGASADAGLGLLAGTAIPAAGGGLSSNSAIGSLTTPTIAADTQQLQNALVDTLLRGQPFLAPATWYLALVTQLGSTTQPGVEVTGSGYARVAVGATLAAWAGTQGAGTVTASTGTSGVVSNNAQIEFAGATSSWGTVVGYEFWDAPTGGNRWISGKLSSPLTINNADPPRGFAPGVLTVGIS